MERYESLKYANHVTRSTIVGKRSWIWCTPQGSSQDFGKGEGGRGKQRLKLPQSAGGLRRGNPGGVRGGAPGAKYITTKYYLKWVEKGGRTDGHKGSTLYQSILRIFF